MRLRFFLAVGLALFLGGCTLPVSKQALGGVLRTPADNATFVTEEDSGLALLGLFQLSEPDHYAVLIERARRRYSCRELHSVQLDFYSEFWVIVSFPVARITAICEHGGPSAVQTSSVAR